MSGTGVAPRWRGSATVEWVDLDRDAFADWVFAHFRPAFALFVFGDVVFVLTGMVLQALVAAVLLALTAIGFRRGRHEERNARHMCAMLEPDRLLLVWSDASGGTGRLELARDTDARLIEFRNSTGGDRRLEITGGDGDTLLRLHDRYAAITRWAVDGDSSPDGGIGKKVHLATLLGSWWPVPGARSLAIAGREPIAWELADLH